VRPEITQRHLSPRPRTQATKAGGKGKSAEVIDTPDIHSWDEENEAIRKKKPLTQEKGKKRDTNIRRWQITYQWLGEDDEDDSFIVCLFLLAARKRGLEQFKHIQDRLMWNVYVLVKVGPTFVILTLFIIMFYYTLMMSTTVQSGIQSN